MLTSIKNTAIIVAFASAFADVLCSGVLCRYRATSNPLFTFFYGSGKCLNFSDFNIVGDDVVILILPLK